MARKSTSPNASLENLKREAKRWLKALHAGAADARKRLLEALPDAPALPTLRTVQHALAREHGLPGWADLKRALSAPPDPASPHERRVQYFLECACPDHHVRGPSDHNEAVHTAMRLLEKHPEIAPHSFITALICGDIDRVRRELAERPELARTKPPGDVMRGKSGGERDRYYRKLGPKGWDPLLFLTHTRLPLPAVTESAVEIARLLLDNGADPNAYFMAGNSRYTPLVGAIGEGEEGRPPHQKRNELVDLLIARGAVPFDEQVLYNIHFRGEVLWYFERMYEYSLRTGRAIDWTAPEWTHLPMGAYGPGAFFWLRVALEKNDLRLAEWLIAHGASPASRPGNPKHFPHSLHEEAVMRGHLEMAELLLRHGAEASGAQVTESQRFTAAVLRLDREGARAIATKHPEVLKSFDPMFGAIKAKSVEAVRLLLDLDISPDVENEQKERGLHIAGYDDQVAIGELLIARGAEIDPVENNYGNTPLDAATYMQAKGMIALLGRVSRDLYYLAYTGNTDRLRQLFAEDPSLARTSKHGTLLMWLPPESDERALAQVKLLLEHGADPNVTDNSGNTAADYAEKMELTKTASLLRSAMTTTQH